MKQVVPIVSSTQCETSPSKSIINKNKRNANILTRIIKVKQVLCTIVFERVNGFKSIYPEQTRKFQFWFAWYRDVTANANEKSDLREILVAIFLFLTNFKNNCDFPVSDGPTKDIKMHFL